MTNIWIGQRVITDNGDTGTILSTHWEPWEENGDDVLVPSAVVELDPDDTTGVQLHQVIFLRDIQLVALDGEDA